MDTVCAELKYSGGSMIAINTIAVENAYTDNLHERSKPDYLIYNDPYTYTELILTGDVEAYLKVVTDYRPMDY